MWPLKQCFDLLQALALRLWHKEEKEKQPQETQAGVEPEGLGLAQVVGESQKSHGDNQIADPVDGGRYGDGGTPGPGGVDLGVDGPGKGAESRGEEGDVDQQGDDGQRGETVVGTAVKEPFSPQERRRGSKVAGIGIGPNPTWKRVGIQATRLVIGSEITVAAVHVLIPQTACPVHILSRGGIKIGTKSTHGVSDAGSTLVEIARTISTLEAVHGFRRRTELVHQNEGPGEKQEAEYHTDSASEQ